MDREAGIYDGWLLFAAACMHPGIWSYEDAVVYAETGTIKPKYRNKKKIVAQAKKMYEEGYTLAEIGRKINVCDSVVKSWSKKKWEVR